MMEERSILMERYEIGRLLGQGTFAKVYYARNLSTGETVAIKMIDKDKVTKIGLTDQIKGEISIMRLVRHPNVLQLFEVMDLLCSGVRQGQRAFRQDRQGEAQ
jgi:5'-AMP-activated protein kinase, catalytic alpha subunit